MSDPISASSHRRSRDASEARPRREWLLRALTALGVGTVILAGLHYHIGVRLIDGSGLDGPLAVSAWVALWLLLASIPLAFIGMRTFPRPLARVVRSTAFFWIGIFGLTLTAVVLTDLARGAYLVLGGHVPPSRLGQVQAGSIVALVVAAVVVGMRTARSPARIERLKFPLPHVGEAFEGFRIVQLSDVHISESLNGAFLQEVVDRVNALQPDLVAITGDLVDGTVDELGHHIAPLEKLRAREGVFFVTGNHEYYFGADAWVAEVRRLGITVLHNAHKVLRRGDDALVLAGVTDHSGGRFDPAHEPRPDLALSGAPVGVPRILLAHQPKTVELASGHGVDLQISGHTHGGQIFPFMFFVRLAQPVISGLRQLAGIWVYTSRGTGYWGPPMRVGPTPEISEITLIRGKRLLPTG